MNFEYWAGIFQVIYFLILIIILLYLFVPVVWPSVKSYISGYMDKDVMYEEESEENINTEQSIDYDYKSYDANFKLNRIEETDDIDDNITSKDNDLYNYGDLLNEYKNEDFLNEYKDALDINFHEKLIIYNKIYKQKLNDIHEAESKYNSTSGIYRQHDTTLERLESEKDEIEKILKVLKYRINNNNIKNIKKNFKLMITNKESGFNSLIGREDIKDYLALQIDTFKQNPKIFFKNYQNIIITGKSGVGKTKLGEVIGYIYCKSGILVRNKFRVITASDLTSKFVNDSGQRTREKILSCLEGFLLIDEAYELGSSNKFGISYNHNSEAVTELTNLLSTYKGLSVVGAAGYHEEMEGFKNANKGLMRRFSSVLHLKSYNSKQLTDILIKFIYNMTDNIKLSDNDANILYTLINYVYKKDKSIFDKQAGDMESLSAHIGRSIYGNRNRTWKNGKTKNNSYLLFKGYKSYLRTKGFAIHN